MLLYVNFKISSYILYLFTFYYNTLIYSTLIQKRINLNIIVWLNESNRLIPT